MPALVTFYALSAEHAEVEQNGAKLASELIKAADIAVECVNVRKKATVLCNTQAQAEAFDELIWQYPADQFVPHNLYGEGPDAGTPVEVLWLDAYKNMQKLRNRAVVINLSQSFIERHQEISHIIDFVPQAETEKVKARERYKQYKQAACQLEYKNA